MSKKRYIVTMTDDSDEDAAIKALSIRKRDLKDAVAAMETDDFDDDVNTLGVPELGVFLRSMTKKEADDVRHEKRVLEVVEDFEVFALDRDEECAGGATFDGCEQQSYEEGYQQALLDMYGSGGSDWGADGSASFSPTPFPPSPFPPSPFPPIWPPRPIPRPPFPPIGACPPGFRKICVPNRPPVAVPPPSLQPIAWNIEMVKADQVWSRVTGRGVKVAVIDTGIDENHPDLIVRGGVSFVPGVTSWDDDQGHGTHCAGTVAARNNASGVVGVAPDAELYAVKVLNSGSSGQLSWILAGMGWCVRNGIQVASMSLGSNVNDPNAPCFAAYQNAARQLERAGCIVVAAAGNSGGNTNRWVGNPARCPGFMAVAAVDRNRRKANFSSWGPPSLGNLHGIEIAAPGVAVRSTVMGGNYGNMSGTSMACPHVSGAAALLMQLRPTWTPAQVRSRLKATAQDLGVPGDDPQFGAGLLDCLAATT